jgi:hypothetical protein
MGDERRTTMQAHSPSAPPNKSLPGSPDTLEGWKAKLYAHIGSREPDALQAVLPALQEYPTDAEILLLAAIAALLDERPEQSARYLHRFTKRYVPFAVEDQLLRAVALAQRGLWPQAAHVIAQHGVYQLNNAIQYLPCGWQLMPWFHNWIRRIEREAQQRHSAAQLATSKKPPTPARGKPRKAGRAHAALVVQAPTRTAPPIADIPRPAGAEVSVPPLPQDDSEISLSVTLPETAVYLHPAAKYRRLTPRLSQEQKGLDGRARMASQWPSPPW